MGAAIRTGDFEGRRAPYAPISALEKFFQIIRDRAVPERIDHRFLQKLRIASNNEYSLLSALKFLAVVDDRGTPTHSYRLLQTTDRFQDTLGHLVRAAYRPVFEAGAERLPDEDLVNFFRVSSSASQARNAARFFRAVCALAGGVGAVEGEPETTDAPTTEVAGPADSQSDLPSGGHSDPPMVEITHERHRLVDNGSVLLATKARLLEKLPAADPSWS
ncbi:MAG: DUF5343 domain-containing protein, partial [Chloroflexota bacterium]|nr:DUF5343 domain-containing protein [Chloroflexota bacterium]